MIVGAVSYNSMPPQKDNKGNKSQEQSGDKKGNDHKENQSQGKGGKMNDNHQSKGNDGRVNQGNKGNDHSEKGEKHNDNASSHGKGNNHDTYRSNKENRGNGNSNSMNGKRDGDIDWNLSDFGHRKHPKDAKKVTICHKPGSSDNSVTINVSENALKAHMNHGDQMGGCTNNYSDRWSSNYIQSRERVYNTYEQTWERVSFSEALLNLAATKLLGIRTNLTTNRSTYSAQEIQRREALILDLQNNINALDNQVVTSRQTLDSDVNIIIKL